MPDDPKPLKGAEIKAWILEQLADPRHFPAFPRGAVEVVRLCDREDAAVEEVARAIARDPGVASRVLRVANSPVMGTSRRVATLPHAVTVLGLRTVGNLTLACFAVDALRDRQIPGFDLPRYWRTSLATAVAARSLLLFSDPRLAEEAFVGGLLQDVGVLQMAAVLGKPYLEMFGKVRGDALEFAALEEETFGMDHAAASAALFATWEFPARLVEAATLHLNPSAKEGVAPPIRRLVSSQHLGERVGWALATEARPATDDFLARAHALLGLDRAQVERVLRHVRDAVAEATAALQIDAGTAMELRALRERAARWIDELAER